MPNPNTVAEVLKTLQAATVESAKLCDAIRALQAMVWRSESWDSDVSAEVAEALRDLAYDLDLYEPDAVARAQDPSYFPEDRAIQEIIDVLGRINRS